ncbi:hypothetical protein ACIQ9J_01735 [Streptomyces sp. NPDC094153]|uniref:hypothetical protein n=1 Tax=Streptomyces sp. NPDC094153 TaxID=3366058 RepID=UPI00382B17BD
MTRFLAGLGFACITGALTYLITQSEPWWLLVGACTAVLVWTGTRAVKGLADAVDDVF